MLLSAGTLILLCFALLRGALHCVEADHLAAIGTFVANNDKEKRQLYMVGALWGAGHASSIFVLTIVAILIKSSLEKSSALFEVFVGLLVVILALRLGYRLLRLQDGDNHSHPHVHSHVSHEHPHTHHHAHSWLNKLGPLGVGLLHGAAGSGVLVGLIGTTIPNTHIALLYILLFGIGSIVGMSLLATVLGKLHATKLSKMLDWATVIVGIIFASRTGWEALHELF